MAGSWGGRGAQEATNATHGDTACPKAKSPGSMEDFSSSLIHETISQWATRTRLCKTEYKEWSCCSSKRPYKVGHPWRSVIVPLQTPDPRRHLLLACGSAPGPMSWVWHLCCPSKRDGLVLGSRAGGSGGNYWLNLRHDMGNPTDLKSIWART